MCIKKTILLLVLLIISSAVSVWGVGEQAGDVIEMIGNDQPAAPQDDAAERAARITAARRAAALKKAGETAAAAKKEQERLAAQKAEDDKNAGDAGDSPTVAAGSGPQSDGHGQENGAVGQDPGTTKVAPVSVSQPAPAKPETAAVLEEAPGKSGTAKAASVASGVAGKPPEGPPENSWWSAFTDMVGLSDSDPGETVQPVSSSTATTAADYAIGPGDLIGISVWRDDSLTRTVVVLPDGKISFPLVGELAAEGKTVAQLKQDLENALSRYMAEANLTVEVKQSNSMIVYITGRVNSPGRQLLVANTNVLQALSMAGGPNPFARKNKIRIFRQHEGKTAMFSFNYDDVMDGRHLETNIELKRGDVIIVP